MQAYLYKWTQKSTGKWYIGCRTARGCHPEDGYICSSKVVKPMILEDRNDWHREILAVSRPEYIRDLEHRYLLALDAASDEMSYNRHNGGRTFTTGGLPVPEEKKQRQREKMKGRKHTPEALEKIRRNGEARRGIKLGPTGPMSEEHRRKIADSKRGKKRAPFSEEHIEKLRHRHQCTRPKSDDWKQQMSAQRAQQNGLTWIITRPDGSTVETNNLKAWCREEFGERYATSASTNMRIKPYKGYTAIQVTSSH